jgi:hypothetical protein
MTITLIGFTNTSVRHANEGTSLHGRHFGMRRTGSAYGRYFSAASAHVVTRSSLLARATYSNSRRR